MSLPSVSLISLAWPKCASRKGPAGTWPEDQGHMHPAGGHDCSAAAWGSSGSGPSATWIKGWTVDGSKGSPSSMPYSPPHALGYGKGPHTLGWDECNSEGWAGTKGSKGKHGLPEWGTKGYSDSSGAAAKGMHGKWQAGEAAGKGQNFPGKGRSSSSQGLPLSDIVRFLNKVYSQAAVKEEDFPADPAGHFLSVCQNVDNFLEADLPHSPLKHTLTAINPSVFDPEDPFNEETNLIASLAWCTQMAAMLRLFYTPGKTAVKDAVSKRKAYMGKLCNDLMRLPVTVQIGNLPPGLVKSIFEMFFFRMGTHFPLLKAVQMGVATSIDDKVSYELTLAPVADDHEFTVHRKLLILLFSLHGQMVAFPGAADKLTCVPGQLEGLFQDDIRPGLQTELYLAALGHPAFTIESLLKFHDDPEVDSAWFFRNDLGLLQSNCKWSREWAANFIREELLASRAEKQSDDGETEEDVSARTWWDEELALWQQQGGKEVHPQDAEDAEAEAESGSDALHEAGADGRAEAAQSVPANSTGLNDQLFAILARQPAARLTRLIELLREECAQNRQQRPSSSRLG